VLHQGREEEEGSEKKKKNPTYIHPVHGIEKGKKRGPFCSLRRRGVRIIVKKRKKGASSIQDAAEPILHKESFTPGGGKERRSTARWEGWKKSNDWWGRWGAIFF